MVHIIIEWVQLICLAFCVGVIVSRLWFFTPSMQSELSYDGNVVPGLWRLFCFGLAFLIAGSIAELVGRSVRMSGRPISEIASVLPVVLFRTHYGAVWLVRIGALLFLALSKAAARYRDRRTFLAFMLILALAVSMTSSASGHGADAGDFSIPEIMDWIHLIAACLWGGGLMVLTFSVLPELIGRRKGSPPLISRVAERFSKMAGVAVALVIITAAYNYLAAVRTVKAMISTPYGLVVTTKVILLAALLILGSFNRYVSVPLLRESAGGPTGPGSAIARIASRLFGRFSRDQRGTVVAVRFRRLVGVETVLILSVLFCAAALRHEIPARHAAHRGGSHEMGASHEHGGDRMKMQ